MALGALLLCLAGQGSEPESAPPPPPPPAAPAAPPTAVKPNGVAAPPSVDVEAELRRAKNEYAYGNYTTAVGGLTGLLYPMRLTTDEQVIEARKVLALSYYLLGKLEPAREEFKKLLFLSPDYELDPYTIAPPIIDVFETVRLQLKPELDAIRQRKSDQQMGLPTQVGFRRVIETRITERSDFATLLPFGVGQFQNGDVGWGVFFAALELTLLSVNIAAHMYANSVGNYSPEQTERRLLVQRLTVAQYAALAMFGLSWSLGVFHARLHFAPSIESTPVVRDEPLAPGAVLRIDF